MSSTALKRGSSDGTIALKPRCSSQSTTKRHVSKTTFWPSMRPCSHAPDGNPSIARFEALTVSENGAKNEMTLTASGSHSFGALNSGPTACCCLSSSNIGSDASPNVKMQSSMSRSPSSPVFSAEFAGTALRGVVRTNSLTAPTNSCSKTLDMASESLIGPQHIRMHAPSLRVGHNIFADYAFHPCAGSPSSGIYV